MYLNDFVCEVKKLHEVGFTCDEKPYAVKLIAFVCDAPARAYVRCIYFECEKCTQKGRYPAVDKVIFNALDSPLRTDEEFRNLFQDHHQYNF